MSSASPQLFTHRGLSYDLARQVAEELSSQDAVRAHARDELGIDIDEMSNPLQVCLVACVKMSLFDSSVEE